MQLFDAHGKRLYLTAEERAAFIAAARKAARRCGPCAPCWTPAAGKASSLR